MFFNRSMVPGWFQIKTRPMRFRVRIRVDAWSDVRVALKVTGFFLYYFCSFKYSPLVNLITNCTLKSISTQSKRLNNYYLLLDLNVFIQRAGWMRAGLMRSTYFCGEPAPWICRYYSICTARCVSAMSPSLRKYSWNESKDISGGMIVFALLLLLWWRA